MSDWTVTEETYQQPSIDIVFKNLTDEEAKAIPKWKNFFFVIWDMDQYLRAQLKYAKLTDEEDEVLDKAREKLWEIMNEHGVSMEDLT